MKYGTQFSTDKQSEPEVRRHESPSQTVNVDPVTPNPEIQDPDFQEQQPEQPPPPTTSAMTTAPSPRRSTRSTAGKTSRYDKYIQTIVSIANILCRELPHHDRYLMKAVPSKGGGEIVDTVHGIFSLPRSSS